MQLRLGAAQKQEIGCDATVKQALPWAKSLKGLSARQTKLEPVACHAELQLCHLPLQVLASIAALRRLWP